MEPAQPSNEKKSRSRLYFGIASGLLFLMALVWAIDPSFVYILTGAALIFGLLGFQNSEFIKNLRKETDHFREGENIFRRQAKNSPENEWRPRRTIGIIKPLVIMIGIAFFISMIVFVIIIVSNDNTGYDSEFLYGQAEIFYGQGEFDSAAIYYRRAITSDIENEKALTGYGNTLMMRQQYDSAIIYYDKALVIDPAYDKAIFQKGAVRYYQKNYPESVALLKTLVDEDPPYVDAYQVIGDDYYNQQQYDSALGWYNKAYENGVRNLYLFYLTGYIHEAKRDNTNAIKYYQEALQYDSTVLDIYQRLGALLPGKPGDFYRRKAVTLEQKN